MKNDLKQISDNIMEDLQAFELDLIGPQPLFNIDDVLFWASQLWNTPYYAKDNNLLKIYYIKVNNNELEFSEILTSLTTNELMFQILGNQKRDMGLS
jgi:hypothetical protein